MATADSVSISLSKTGEISPEREPFKICEESDLQGGRAVSSDCVVCGNRLPKNRVTFIAQIVAIYGIIIVSAVNLSINSGSNQELWIALLSSAVGYVLPSPGLKYRKAKATFGPTLRDEGQ